MLIPVEGRWWPREARPDVVIAMVVLLAAGAIPAIWKGLAGNTNDTLTIQEAFAAPLAAVAGPAIACIAVHGVTFLVGRLPGERGRLWWRRVEHQSGRYLELAAAWATWRALEGHLEPAIAVALGTAAATTMSWFTGLGSRIMQDKAPKRESWMPLFREFTHQLVWLPALAAMAMLLAHHGWLAVLLLLSPVSVFHMSVSRDARRFAAESRVDVDQLTMLPGQGRFYKRLATELARAGSVAESVALIILDLDDFKKLNDEAGHIAGDECLRHVSRALSGSFRENDTLYRYGGEEFALIIPGAGLDAAKRAGERARRAVASVRYPRSITASVGVACFPADGRDPRSLVEAADRGLYEAKRGGKNRVSYGRGAVRPLSPSVVAGPA
jgi:diguanylate cyclase (GGDEF)-like protein